MIISGLIPPITKLRDSTDLKKEDVSFDFQSVF